MSIFSRISNAWRALRSLENPSTSLGDPDEWLYDAFGAGPSSSGIRVGPESALSYSPVWRCTNLISRDVAKLPCILYERQGEGKRRAMEHPAYPLLKRKPNAEMTAFIFWQLMVARALLRGNALAFIARRGDGSPTELIPLDPDTTTVLRADGVLWYLIGVSTSNPRKLRPIDVFHLKGLGCDGIWGYSVVHKAKDSLGRGIGAGEYGSRFFANDARPSVVLEHPSRLGDQAIKHLKESWNAAHQGVDNWHKPAILEEGMKVHAFSLSGRDAQLLETRQFEIREVANWFGVPPHKVGDSSKTAYNSLESENQSYLDEALDAWLVAIEHECYDKLLTEDQKKNDTHVIEFMRQALVRADIAARGQFYNLMLMNGVMNRDEVRARENLNPIPNGEGQKFLTPMNMAPVGAAAIAAAPPKPEDDPGEDEEDQDTRLAALVALEHAVARKAARLSQEARIAKRRNRLGRWIDKREAEELKQTIIDAIEPCAAVIRTLGGIADAALVTERMITQVLAAVTGSGDIESALEKYEREIPAMVRSSTGLEES